MSVSPSVQPAPASAVTGRAAHPTHGLAYVPALDGLRAVAVSLVMAYHFGVPGLRGGFMGVDLFFVLSGFLITTLLLGEHTATGAIDLVQFWLRRARRLLPALFILIAAIALWSTTATAYEKGPLRWDLLGSLFYVANWRFIASGQSYFAEFSTASPVRHLWSLAIEEQFYVVWPLLTLAALTLVARGRLKLWTVATVLAGAAVLSAALLAATYDEADASLAYYSTLSRAHELLIGAGAAGLLFFRPGVRAWVAPRAHVLLIASLAVVLAFGVLMTDSQSIYYFGGSIVFSVAAAVAVASAVAGRGSGGGLLVRALELRWVVLLGTISYGVYLWHWPFTIWLDPTTIGLNGVPLFLARLGATLLTASISFYLVERPIRRGSIGQFKVGRIATVTGAVLAALVLATGSVLATRGWKPPPDFLVSDPQLRASLVPGSDATVGIVGDSIALSLYPGLRAVAAERHLSVVAATLPGCAIGDSLRTDADRHLLWDARRCAGSTLRLQSQMIARYDPTVVFWHSTKDRYDIREGTTALDAGTDAWLAAEFADWDRTLARLRSSGAHVVLLLPMYAQGSDPSICNGPDVLSSKECTRPFLTNGALRFAYRLWADRHPNDVQLIDLADRLCPPGSRCPAILDGVNLRRDLIHFSTGGGRLVSSWLLDSLPPGELPEAFNGSGPPTG